MTVNSQPDFNPASYANLAAMVNAAPLLIACIGPDLRYRQVNAEYERVYQRPREWFAGRKLAQALPPHIYREILPRLEMALSGVAVDFEYEGNFTRAEPAQVRHLRARYTPNIVNGRQDGIVVVIEDITRYRSVARALDTSQEQLKEIVDHVPVFIAYFSADLRYKFVNAAYERWYGKPRQWFVGRTIREVMGPENFARVESQMHRVMDGETVHFVFERRAPNGDCTHVLDTHFVPDFDADGVRGIYCLVTDDTQRRVAQDAALRAQWEMRAVADNLPALITYIDADLRYRYVNASFLSWYQQPPQDFIGHRVEDLVGSVFALTGPLLRRAAQGESLDFEYPRRNDNFADPDRVLRVQLLPDTVAGITRGFIALIDDITDARRAENALRRAEQELRAVIDTIPALVAAFDMEARFIYVNRSFAEWCGRPESWFPGRRAEAVMAPALAALVMPTIQRVLAGEHVMIEPQCALIRPRDGAERYCRAQYVPLMDGQVQRGFVGTAQDVTEWREINRALRQQEIRLRQIADASSEAFALSDLQRREISYASPAFERIFGLAGRALEGRGLSWLTLVHPDDRLQIGEQFAQTLQRGGFSAEYRITRPNGEIRWVHDQADLVRNDDGTAIGLASIIGDITERRESQQALQHSEMRLSQIVETISDGFWLLTLDNTAPFYVSAGFATIFGRSCAQAKGNAVGWLETVHSEDREHMASAFSTMLGGAPLDAEYRILRPDGEVRWVHNKGRSIRDPDGRPLAIAGVVTDVTERHLQYRERVEYARRLERAQTVGNLGFWQLDLDDWSVHCSARWCDIFDLPAQLASGTFDEILSRIHRDDRDRLEQVFATALESGQPYDFDHRIVRSDGAVRFIHEQGSIEFDADGHARRLVGISQDVTERKSVELQLRENELRLRQITEHVNQVFWLMEAHTGKLIYISPAFASTWDLPLEDAYRAPPLWLKQVHPDDASAMRAAFRRCLVSGHGDQEFRIVKTSGERWLRARAFPIDDEHGQLARIAGFVEDITDRKRVAELQRLKDEAEGANRTKTEFLSKMSHELRTPLNAILGFSQLMHYDQGHPLDAQQRESVDEILTAGHHLLNIVDEMLDLTRIEIGKLKVTLEPTDLRDICTECLAMVQSEARQRDIELSFANESRRHTWALADRTRVRQIVLNLLGNAVKYNLPHGAVDISIDSRAAPGYLRILVADNGPGLSAEQIGKLFVPFQRLDAERISVEGLGLGLALSKQLAEAMGGALGARGTVGEGCTFWLDLPVADKA